MGELFSFFASAFLFSVQPVFAEEISEKIPPQNIEITAPAVEIGSFQPNISAPSVLILDVDSSGIVWEKNAEEKRAMASLTKLMVALIIMENHDFSEIVQVPVDFRQIEGAKMKLVAGESMTLGNLMKGLLIPSGNDAARVLAIHHSGSESAFVEEMNLRAYYLGMENTRFVNVHGLDEEGHYSTAKDLGILARKVLQYSDIRTIANTQAVAIPSLNGGIIHDVKNTNELLGTSFPVYGLKTGTTDEAGECLITLFRGKGKEMLIIVLGSENRFFDTKALLFPFL